MRCGDQKRILSPRQFQKTPNSPRRCQLRRQYLRIRVQRGRTKMRFGPKIGLLGRV